MVTFLLVVIVCLLINRKLGLFVLFVPMIGFALLMLWVLIRETFGNGPPPETYAQCVERWTPNLCTTPAWQAGLIVALVSGLVWLALDPRRVNETIQYILRQFRR